MSHGRGRHRLSRYAEAGGPSVRGSNGGLISTASAQSLIYCYLIIKLAVQYKLPTVYQERSYGCRRRTDFVWA